jgi:opacity protein-like surface antigen
MNKVMVTILAAFAIWIVHTLQAEAGTLLGTNYFGTSVAIIQFGDDLQDDVLGTGYGVSAFGNFNLRPNLDLALDVAYVWADGALEGVKLDLSGLGADAGLVYFFKPGEKVNPFLRGGILIVYNEVEGSSGGVTVKDDDTEFGGGGGAGLEFEATEKVLARVALDYSYVDSEDSIPISAQLGYWFSDRVLGAIGGAYDFDSEDLSGEFGVIFTL